MRWYRKGKTNLYFTEARNSEWQWHQLGHMQVCTSLQGTDDPASTPPLSFLQAGCTFCRPTNSVKALKVARKITTNKKHGWRRGVVVNGDRRLNEVDALRARLLLGWVTVFGRIRTRCVTSQLGQRSLASLRGRLIGYQLRLK